MYHSGIDQMYFPIGIFFTDGNISNMIAVIYLFVFIYIYIYIFFFKVFNVV